MHKSRLEAFSDGVLAIIITIMVLELSVPHEASFAALCKLWPVMLSYILSFIYVGIYWGNHHHLLYTVHHVNSKIIWANMGLLFCLSLVPFTTGWMGENHFSSAPLFVYSLNLALCGVAYVILQQVILGHYNHDTQLTIALKKQKWKGLISFVIYLSAAGMAFIAEWVSLCLIFIPAVLWIIPDKNIEKAFNALESNSRETK